MEDVIIINGVKYRRVEEETETARPRTGYERVAKGKTYYTASVDSYADDYTEESDASDDTSYNRADYYSDELLCADNIRADLLMRRLRQWQALNDEPVDWKNEEAEKYYIIWFYRESRFITDNAENFRTANVIYFSSKEKAEEAIEVFRDELLWYFTEYRQRLDEAEHK